MMNLKHHNLLYFLEIIFYNNIFKYLQSILSSTRLYELRRWILVQELSSIYF